MTLYDDYVNIVQKYKSLYGEQILVVIEVGSFYEWYNCDENKGCDVRGICELLNVQWTRQSKSVPTISRSNPMLGGVPKIAFSKFLPVLLDNDYTVVIVSQFCVEKNKYERKVTDVLSKGTYLYNPTNGTRPLSITANESNFTMSIYIDYHPTKGRRFQNSMLDIIYCGVSFIDVTTGESASYEINSTEADPNYVYDELFRLVQEYIPVEVALYGKKRAISYECGEDLFNFAKRLSLSEKIIRSRLDDKDSIIRFTTIKFQEEILKNVFNDTGFLTALEALDFDNKPHAAASFVALLQYLYEHNEEIIKNIKKPNTELLNDSSQKRLNLNFNAAQQLDIWNVNSQITLCSKFNNCVTAVGRKKFRNELLHPLIHVSDICNRLDDVASFTDITQNEKVRSNLKNVSNIDKILRRLSLQKCEPTDIYSLDNSLINLENALQNCLNKQLCTETIQIVKYIKDNFSAIVVDKINPNEYGDHAFKRNIFRPGLFTELDICENSMLDANKKLQNILHEMNNIHGNQNFFTLECNQDSSNNIQYYIQGTPKRCMTLKQKAGDTILWKNTRDEFSFHNLTVQQSTKSSSNLEHPLLQKWCEDLRDCTLQLIEKGKKHFLEFQIDFWSKISTYADMFVDRVAYLDFISCCAYNAIKYKHVKPSVIQADNEKSFLNCKQLRHPVIETLNSQISFIPNDVCVDDNGILLYGMNAAGKSCLMKSIAMAVVMAQAGMFVAADSLELSPYHNIFTRIQSKDDISRGQSTFMVEMSELRSILHRCNSNSLVIGDEVCSCTETVSALSIVGATLDKLIKTHTSFLFATHLHELTNITEVNENIKKNKIKVYHMLVRCDNKTGELIYDRVLCEGQGPTIYGLEVCKALDMDDIFLDVAHKIRKDVLSIPNTLGGTQVSKYNSSLIKNKCAVCGYNPCEEVHHIKKQVDADVNGYIGNVHKNALCNLVALCHNCHQKVHNGHKLEIHGFVQTSKGPVLEFYEV